MANAQSNQFGKRAVDALDKEPTLRDIYALQLETRDHLARIDSAFVRDDLQEPDYGGHRKAHLAMLHTANTLEQFKMSMASKVFGGLLVFLLGLLMSGSVSWLKGLVR